LGCPFKTPSFL